MKNHAKEELIKKAQKMTTKELINLYGFVNGLEAGKALPKYETELKEKNK